MLYIEDFLCKFNDVRRSFSFVYSINIASPKLKNLYFCCTASLYAFITNSLLARADTSIISVDSGKWKFVIRLSTHLNLYPGYIKIFVSASTGFSKPFSSATDSSTLQDVVPTAITLFPFCFALFILSASSCLM